MEREAKDWRSVMITADKAGYAHLHVCRAQPTTVILHRHGALQTKRELTIFHDPFNVRD